MCQTKSRNAEETLFVHVTFMTNASGEERSFTRNFHFIVVFTSHIAFNGLNHQMISDCDALCLFNKEKWKRLNICVINLPVA